MRSQAAYQYLPHFGRLIAIAAVLSANTVGRRASGQSAMAIEPSPPVVSQAPPYMRHRPGPSYGRRPFRPPWNGNMGYPGTGFGYGGFAPWFPGGFFSPPIQGSWYQRPYPYHFDIYRGRFGGNPQTRPDAMGQFGQPSWDDPSDPPGMIP